jgi:hypothetical protein
MGLALRGVGVIAAKHAGTAQQPGGPLKSSMHWEISSSLKHLAHTGSSASPESGKSARSYSRIVNSVSIFMCHSEQCSGKSMRGRRGHSSSSEFASR